MEYRQFVELLIITEAFVAVWFHTLLFQHIQTWQMLGVLLLLWSSEFEPS